MRSLRFLSLVPVPFIALLAACMTDSPRPEQPKRSLTGGAELFIRLDQVGSLSKVSIIEMQELVLTFSASGEDTLRDTVSISGNSAQTVSRTVNGLARSKNWTMAVVAKDTEGMVIYSGSQAFLMPTSGTASVSLTLAAQYSMLKAQFFPIYDSVTHVELRIDGIEVADSTFAKQSLLGDTVELEYDYLSASTAGTPHIIRMAVYGLKAGGDTAILYRGDTTISVVSGQDASYSITLYWVDSASAPTGPAAVTVSLGTMGNVRMSGRLEAGFEPLKWGIVGDGGLAGTRYLGGSFAVSHTGIPYVVVSGASGLTVRRFVGTGWQSVGPAGGFTQTVASSPKLVLALDSIPYVSYYKPSGGTFVERWNGTSWEQLGDPELTSGAILDISSDGVPYLASIIGSQHLTVKKWNGSIWDTTGFAVYTGGGQTGLPVFKLSKSNVLHAVVSVNTSRFVMRYNGTSWESIGSLTLGSTDNSFAMGFSASNQLYVSYSDNSDGVITVKRWNGTLWENVGTPGFGNSVQSPAAFAFLGDVPYLAYRDASNGHKASLRNWNGSAWNSVGVPGFTAGEVASVSLAISSSGTPYVAASESLPTGAFARVLRYNLP